MSPLSRQPISELEEGPSRLDGGLHLNDRGIDRPLSSLSDEAIWEGLARALRVFARLEGERRLHG